MAEWRDRAYVRVYVCTCWPVVYWGFVPDNDDGDKRLYVTVSSSFDDDDDDYGLSVDIDWDWDLKIIDNGLHTMVEVIQARLRSRIMDTLIICLGWDRVEHIFGMVSYF